MLKSHFILVLCFFWLLTETSYAQTVMKDAFGDKAFYLIDSLVVAEISESDKRMIDSTLTLYHAASHDTAKLNHLNYIIEECWNENVWPKYNQYMHKMVKKLLSSKVEDASLQNKYLIALANTLNNIGFYSAEHSNNLKAIKYYTKSLKINEDLASSPDPSISRSGKAGMATSLNNIGLSYRRQGDIYKSLEYQQRSLKILEQLDNKKGLSGSLNNIGSLYTEVGDIINALEFFHRSLKISEEIDYNQGKAASLNNIGAIYKRQGDTIKALEYYHISLSTYRAMDYNIGIAYSLNNIGSIYSDQGDTIKALEYYEKSLKLNEESSYTAGIAFSLNNIAGLKDKQGHVEVALEYFLKSLKISEEIGEKKGMTYTLNKIGGIELMKGSLDQALKYGTKGLTIAKEMGSPRQISASANILFKVAKKQAELTNDENLGIEKYKEALTMYELYILMRDSIRNESTEKATIRQQTKYEFEKSQLIKEQLEKDVKRVANEQRQRRDNLQYSIILIAILVLFGVVLGLGFLKVSERMAEGIIFFSFLIFFEFLLVLADPYIDRWSSGAPGNKLLFNAAIAALIFPLHSFFETSLKGRLTKHNQ
ncbi:MAG: hypothetical protein COB85_03690 [Bacteroidetes bacterium]|nr:MAG: hypothetical protein COB85_03690 [Bacteroidota bacterium]